MDPVVSLRAHGGPIRAPCVRSRGLLSGPYLLGLPFHNLRVLLPLAAPVRLSIPCKFPSEARASLAVAEVAALGCQLACHEGHSHDP